jgi:hypothetical protein
MSENRIPNNEPDPEREGLESRRLPIRRVRRNRGRAAVLAFGIVTTGLLSTVNDGSSAKNSHPTAVAPIPKGSDKKPKLKVSKPMPRSEALRVDKVKQVVYEDGVTMACLEAIKSDPDNSVTPSEVRTYPANTSLYNRPADLSETGDSSTNVVTTVPEGQSLVVTGTVTCDNGGQQWQEVTLEDDENHTDTRLWVPFDQGVHSVFLGGVEDLSFTSVTTDQAGLIFNGQDSNSVEQSYLVGRGMFHENPVPESVYGQ